MEIYGRNAGTYWRLLIHITKLFPKMFLVVVAEIYKPNNIIMLTFLFCCLVFCSLLLRYDLYTAKITYLVGQFVEFVNYRLSITTATMNFYISITLKSYLVHQCSEVVSHTLSTYRPLILFLLSFFLFSKIT